jgi:hypothetical protein
METATLLLVEYCIIQLCYRVPTSISRGPTIFKVSCVFLGEQM